MNPLQKPVKTILLILFALVSFFLLAQLMPSSPSSAHGRLASTPSAYEYLPLVSHDTSGVSATPTVPAPSPSPTSSPVPSPSPSPDGFLETFDGDPAGPTPWNASTWDVTVHSRDRDTWYTLEEMQAQHGPDCSPPPATHYNDTYEGAVYQCKNHVMTAINASGYGVVYLAPNQLADFSDGEVVIRWDVSTSRTSLRDWWDIWITPYEDNLQLPLEDFRPDLQGEPARGLQIHMDTRNGETNFRAYRIVGHGRTEISGQWWVTYESFLDPSATRRDTFELRISPTHVKFGMPDYDFWWIDTDIPALDWSQGVVQLGHHSYNPWKNGNSGPNTWHWDNVNIDPAVPFTILPAGQRYVESATDPVTFSSPAPAGANLRFAGIGEDVEVSFDGGATWQTAQLQDQEIYDEGHFRSYWTPIPAGTSTVHFRAQEWWGGDWHVRDISIWSLEN